MLDVRRRGEGAVGGWPEPKATTQGPNYNECQPSASRRAILNFQIILAGHQSWAGFIVIALYPSSNSAERRTSCVLLCKLVQFTDRSLTRLGRPRGADSSGALARCTVSIYLPLLSTI